MCINKRWLIFFSIFLSLIASFRSAHAEVINFDDLQRITDPLDPFWADQPISDQYVHKGLYIDDGYLNEYFEGHEHSVSGPNYLQGGPFLTFYFTGQPPKFVSLVVTSSNKDAVTLEAACGDGSVLTATTPGWAGPDNDVPFKPNNLISFASEHGVSKISVSAFYFLRTSAMIDDITFHYAVPEPSAALLLIIAMMILVGRRVGKRSGFLTA